VTTRSRLDFIINNACQTVRRPPEFYKHMMEVERSVLDAMAPDVRKLLRSIEGSDPSPIHPTGRNRCNSHQDNVPRHYWAQSQQH